MSTKKRFEKLLSPGYIGKLRIKNRIIRPGAIMEYVDKEGFITAKHLTFYEALARGGAGMVIAGGCCVDYPLGIQDFGMIRIDDDKFIPGFTELAQIVHKYDCRIFAQILHAGYSHPSFITGLPPVSSSCIPLDKKPQMTEIFFTKYALPPTMPPLRSMPARELSIPEIKELVLKFSLAAERLHKAGCDGVEVNGASSHLINSFLSHIWNKRQDEYGCNSMENRTRFFVEIIREIKKRLGQDFPVTCRFNDTEYGHADGITIEEAKSIAKILEAAGADGFHCLTPGYSPDSGVWHWNEQVFYPEPPEHLAPGLDWSGRGAGATLPLAAAIKSVVSVPVMAIGRLDPVLGEKALREGKADFIGLQRRLMADPELPNKIAEGRLEDIAPCTACLHCLETTIPVPCRINAALGSDGDYAIPPADNKKKVVVVGGGPAGMEAARVAAIRGHEVILYEKEPKLGGLLPMASLVKGIEIEDLVSLIRYLKTQITKLGVKVRLGKEFRPSLVEEIKPDVVIIAIGGIPVTPEIPGIENKKVVNSADLHRTLKFLLKFIGPQTLRWLTKFWMPIGKRVVIIGGDIHGCELAEFLVKRGRKVTIVEKAGMLGDGLPKLKKGKLLHWFEKKGVTTFTDVKYEEITDKGLIITTRESKRRTIEVDSVVPSTSIAPNFGLFKALKEKVPEVYIIGDSAEREPRLIINAIADGYHTARAI